MSVSLLVSRYQSAEAFRPGNLALACISVYLSVYLCVALYMCSVTPLPSPHPPFVFVQGEASRIQLALQLPSPSAPPSGDPSPTGGSIIES